MELKKPVIITDPQILGGTPVFAGTRVPVKNLIDYLEAGDSLEKFLDAFPSVTREQAVAALELKMRYDGGAMISKTVTAIFDGRVLQPELPLDLEPNSRYVITIREVAPASLDDSAWDVLEKLTGVVDAPSDWAMEHDHYLYGTSKKHATANL